jgi:hypothetical protein
VKYFCEGAKYINVVGVSLKVIKIFCSNSCSVKSLFPLAISLLLLSSSLCSKTSEWLIALNSSFLSFSTMLILVVPAF